MSYFLCHSPGSAAVREREGEKINFPFKANVKAFHKTALNRRLKLQTWVGNYRVML